MDSLKERDMADEYIYFDVESFHQFLEFIIGKLLVKNELTAIFRCGFIIKLLWNNLMIKPQ